MTTTPTGFSVVRRNFGHWDICTREAGRVFRIRGGPGRYLAMDERESPYPVTEFKTITACMSFICDALMHELIVAEGQTPQVIEAWNV
ncbi:MAG: hypothetical protein ACYCZR_00320 [Burkholderiales bacterium]